MITANSNSHIITHTNPNTNKGEFSKRPKYLVALEKFKNMITELKEIVNRVHKNSCDQKDFSTNMVYVEDKLKKIGDEIGSRDNNINTNNCSNRDSNIKWINKFLNVFMDVMKDVIFFAPLKESIREEMFNKTVSDN